MELPLVDPRDPTMNPPSGRKVSEAERRKRCARNSRLRELGYYIDLGGTAFEVPRIYVE
jgi:hypothetical protein